MNNSIMNCAACGADMNLGDTFCQNCGNPITTQTPQKSGRMARLLNKYADKAQDSPPPAQDNAVAPPLTDNIEPLIAFASGLPVWSIEPPVAVVRRKGRT